VHCSETVFMRLRRKFVFMERGEMSIKGKGVMRTYFLEREFNADDDALVHEARRLMQTEV
jgi:hypothetical protein